MSQGRLAGMAKCYQALDHTGDIGAEVWGSTPVELFQNASLALVDILVDPERVRPQTTVEWALEADSPEGLLVLQLQEILYQMDANGLIFCKFEVQLMEPNRLRCRAFGEALDRERHGFKTELKAVTYHRLKIWTEADGRVLARIIFDV